MAHLEWILGVTDTGRLEMDVSALVDLQGFVGGRLVPPDPCETVEISWSPSAGGLTDVALGVSPFDGQNCDVGGTTHPPLLTLGFGDGGSVSFSGGLPASSSGIRRPAGCCGR